MAYWSRLEASSARPELIHHNDYTLGTSGKHWLGLIWASGGLYVNPNRIWRQALQSPDAAVTKRRRSAKRRRLQAQAVSAADGKRRRHQAPQAPSAAGATLYVHRLPQAPSVAAWFQQEARARCGPLRSRVEKEICVVNQQNHEFCAVYLQETFVANYSEK